MCHLGVDAVWMRLFEQMHMQMPKKATVVTDMFFMALAVSWKGIAVSRLSVQTLFIIIIIIINPLSSGVRRPGNALNHRPYDTCIRWNEKGLKNE